MSDGFVMSDREIENRTQKAQEAAKAAYERSPRKGAWGIFAYGDASPAIGGGIGAFCWFESQADAVAYVRDHIVFTSPGRGDIDPGRVAQEVEAAIESLEHGSSDMDQARVQVNNAMKTFSQIEWWNTFEDVVAGSGAFPRMVRSLFREDESEDPIGEAEMAEFLEYIPGYGF